MKLPALRPVVALLLTGLAVGTLVACGPGSSNAGPAGGGATGSGGGASGVGGSAAGAGRGAGFRGVSGLIVAVSGTTMQVRTTDGQTAVSYGSKTSVTEQRNTSSGAATAGMCAVVRGTNSSSGAGGASLTAMSVNLSSPTNGSCTGGFGGGPRPGGAPPDASVPPRGGAPSTANSAGPSGRRFGGGANGKIVSVSKSSMVIEQMRPATTTANSVTVTLTDQTTYTKQAKVPTQAIAKGKCVLAVGKTDSTGAMTARALRLSPALNGSCSVGFRGRGSGAPSGARAGG
jgi:hypothetical protein